MANCHICDLLPICPWASPEEIICSSFKPKRMTNGDKIRAMTDEEMAGVFDLLTRTKPETEDDKKLWLDWLKKEAE